MHGIKHCSWNGARGLPIKFGFQVEFLQGDCVEVLTQAHIVGPHRVDFGFKFFDVIDERIVLFVGLSQQLVKLINMKSVFFDLLLQYVDGLL